MLKLKLHVQFWADLPHEVLATVLSLLPTAQCWKARRVSKAWARQVRQTTSFEVTIRAKPSNLARKVQALFRQQLQQSLPYAVITFQITWPLHLDNLLVLLQTLRAQRKYLSSFRLEVSLVIFTNSTVSQTGSQAKQVEYIASGLLTNYGLELSIKLKSAKGADTVPPPAVLQSLAPFLASIQIHKVGEGTSSATHSAVTSAHIAALQSYNRHLSVLSISELDPLQHVPPAFQMAISISDIALLTSLTTLRLQFDNSSQLAGFQPLSQLSSLTDLTLQCACDLASCAGVLESSRHTLCRVNLASNSWSLDTYSALQQIQHLDLLVLRLYVPSASQIDALAGITARNYQLRLHQLRFLPDQPLLNLSAAMPTVHNLCLYNIDDAICQQLGTLTSLQTLFNHDSPHLTGTSACFNPQPKLTNLRFFGCPGISGVGVEGMKQIMWTAMPAFKGLPCTVTRATGQPDLAWQRSDTIAACVFIAVVCISSTISVVCNHKQTNKG